MQRIHRIVVPFVIIALALFSAATVGAAGRSHVSRFTVYERVYNADTKSYDTVEAGTFGSAAAAIRSGHEAHAYCHCFVYATDDQTGAIIYQSSGYTDTVTYANSDPKAPPVVYWTNTLPTQYQAQQEGDQQLAACNAAGYPRCTLAVVATP